MKINRLDHTKFREIVEDRLFLELTDSYVKFVEQLIVDRDPKAVAMCWEIACDPQRVIEINKLLESSHIEGWPDSYLAVGESGCGDYYAIDLDDEDSEVLFWNHESGTFQGDEDFADLDSYAERFLPK